MSISPNQKLGNETPNKAIIIIETSVQEYCFVAEMMPAIIPITTVMTILHSASSIVIEGGLILRLTLGD